MAEQDASLAIQNALQKFDQQPNLVHEVETFKSVKSELHRLGSHLNKFNSSELTQVREIAYDAEDVMDNVTKVVENTAQQRWRKLAITHKLTRAFFPSRADMNKQLVEKRMEAIHKRTTSIRCDKAESETRIFTSERSDEIDVKADIPPEKDVFYLSLSGFPAEVEISARQLIQIWLAEGFLDPQGSTAMKEEGREHINWLLEKDFITEVQKGTCGTLKTFKIATDKLNTCKYAAKKEYYLLHVNLDTSPGHNQGNASAAPTMTATHKPPGPTRLAIHNSNGRLSMSDIQSSCGQLSEVRYLQIHCSSSSGQVNHLDCETKQFLKRRNKEFDSLRVLDLGGLKLETVPEVIGKLTHLRYLRLRAPNANRIPPSICDLHNLQTIDMKETKRVKSMPLEIWKMKTNLRHLHLGGGTALPAPRRANHYNALEKLQTLSGVCPDKELKRLMVRAKFPNVTRLRLHSNKNKEEFLSFLNSLDHLYHLRSLTLRGAIGSLPSDWNAFPPSLTKMTLLKTGIPVKTCIETLQNLPNLRYLKLMEESVTGKDMECAAGGFPALQVLRMKSLKELETWQLEKGAMQLLRDLEVKHCERLQRVKAFQPSKELRKALEDSLNRQLLAINPMTLPLEVWIDPASDETRTRLYL